MRRNWRKKFNEIALEGRVRERYLLCIVVLTIYNKSFFASSNMYIICGIYFITIIEGYRYKICIGVNESDEY